LSQSTEGSSDSPGSAMGRGSPIDRPSTKSDATKREVKLKPLSIVKLGAASSLLAAAHLLLNNSRPDIAFWLALASVAIGAVAFAAVTKLAWRTFRPVPILYTGGVLALVVAFYADLPLSAMNGLLITAVLLMAGSIIAMGWHYLKLRRQTN